MKVWRQGDIYLTPATLVPSEASPRPGRVIFKGELTGHAHRFEDQADVQLFTLPSDDPTRPGPVMFARVDAPARLVHEEHGAIALSPGIYRLWRQREYTPGAIRAVQD